MLALTRKVDYALGALSYLAEHSTHVSSAREIAQAGQMPLPLLMKILKLLHRRGVIDSTRGAKGGYVISANLDQLSLRDLLVAVEGQGALRAVGRSCCAKEETGQTNPSPVVRGPVQALNYKLVHFLSQVMVSDLVMPGRRIDVPVELIRPNKANFNRNPVPTLALVPAN